jgi:hypothetical protein
MSSPRLAVALGVTLTIALVAACGSDDGDETGEPSPTPSVLQPAATTSVCAGSIPPLTTGSVTKERLETAVQKMGEVQQAAEAGDDASARAAFSGDTHAVTHDIDQPLRAADPLLARDLCESIVVIEQEFNGAGDLEAVAAEAGISAQLLEDSGRAMGLID